MTDQPTPAAIAAQIQQLESLRPTLGNVAVDAAIAALRQQLVELAPPPSGHIEAGRDISARDIITGVQHITQLYLDTGGRRREADYRRALARYLAWLADAVGQVVLRGILKRAGQEAVALSLADIYVPLAAETRPEDDDRLQRQMLRLSRKGVETRLAGPGLVPADISMRELLAQGPRLIVIGAPGCGKTTVLQHIAFTLCRALQTNQPELAKTELGLTGPLPLPIYVPLNRFAEHRRRFADHPDPHQRQLATFISHYLIEKQAGLDVPENFFAALVDQGRHLILLLDGLDEVPNETERALVSEAVTDLTHGRPHLRVVVTSRSRAYQGEAVLGSQFTLARVRPLTPEQVADLIHHAYRAIYPQPHHQAQREQLAADLIDGVTRLEADRAERLGDQSPESRLVTTPLMVRLLLIVHVNQRRLPDQRAELYAEVVDTLLTSAHHPDRWVAKELAQLGGDWRSRRDILQFLAFQMHSRGPEAGRDIAEPALIELLTGYLTERRQKASELAEKLMADFVQMSRQRESLLEEIGGRYRFGHLSFQEFLTARYLIEIERNRSGVSGIVAFVSAEGRATDSWWREVILLMVGYLNVTSPDAAVELITALAGLDAETPPLSALALSLAELAAVAFLEWGGAEATQRQLADRLADLLTDRSLSEATPPLRAAAGRALARLGDLRAGVLTLPPQMTGVIEGRFWYGGERKSAKKEERETAPFRAAVYPITNAQYRLFMEAGGYTNQKWWSNEGWQWRTGQPRYDWQKMDRPDFWDDSSFNGDNQPVVGITWYEAEAFCNWLSEWANKQISESANRRMDEVTNDDSNAPSSLVTRHSSLTFRLPTETEWERLARGQNGREYPWGNEWDAAACNTAEGGIERTSAVGVFPGGESPTGTHDCAGNVWEWCADWYDKEHKFRVLRGGSWGLNRNSARCAVRFSRNPHGRHDFSGFRVVSPISGSES